MRKKASRTERVQPKFKTGDIITSPKYGEKAMVTSMNKEYYFVKIYSDPYAKMPFGHNEHWGIMATDEDCILHPESIIDKLLEKYK